MSIDLLLKALAVFIFHNNGWRDVIPVAIALFALWTTAAGAYLLIAERQPPKFFGVPARRARWAYSRRQVGAEDFTLRVLPWKWKSR